LRPAQAKKVHKTPFQSIKADSSEWAGYNADPISKITKARKAVAQVVEPQYCQNKVK
jgi:hypothetical protein